MKRLLIRTVFLSTLAVCFCAGRVWAAQVFEDYSARPAGYAVQATTPPIVDGDLSDEAYTYAQPLKGFNSRFLRLPASQQTEARLVRTGEGLFAAIHCEEEEMGDVVSITKDRDGAVDGDNSIELTIAPTDDFAKYFRFAVNTLGTQYDQSSGSTEWNGQWTVAVRTEASGWTAEFFIPWNDLGQQPGLNECWGLGIGRVEGPFAEYSNWGIVQGDYGQRERHGQIRFTDQPSLPYLELNPLERLVPGFNALSGNIVRPASGEASYTVQFQQWEVSPDQPPREVDMVKQELTGADSHFRFEPKIEHPGTYMLSLTLLGESEVLYRTTLGFHVKPVQGEQFALEPKQPIYTWEEEARFYLSIDPSVGSVENLAIESKVYNQTGNLLQSKKEPVAGAHHVVLVPIQDFPNGTYRTDISVLAGEEIVESWSVMFDRSSSIGPSPQAEIREDKTLCIDGQPIYPIGMYEVPDIAEFAESGFNTVIDRNIPDFSSEREAILYLDRCRELGLFSILNAEPFLVPDLDREGLREAVCRVKDHPALLGYVLINHPSRAGIEPGHLDTARAIIRDVDRFHPVFVMEETPVMFSGYSNTCDLFIPACNPIPSGSLDMVGNVISRAWQAMKGNRSMIPCLQAFAPENGRHPTLEESRVMAWMALLHNARGLFWWSCQETKRAGHWEDMKIVAKDLKPILPYLLNGAPSEMEISDLSPGVYLRSWTLGEKRLVLAASTRADAGRIALRGPLGTAVNLRGGEPPIEAAVGANPPMILLNPLDVAALEFSTGTP